METKQCTKCGEIKPLELFNRASNFRDGRRSYCKECQRAMRRQYDSRPNAREIERNRARQYKGRYPQHLNKEKNLAAIKLWQERNPLATKAHHAVENAIRRGHIPKPTELQCTNCDKPGEHYHHLHGYDLAFQLEVIPLCHSCHRLLHQIEK